MQFCVGSLKDLFKRVNPSAITNFIKDIHYYDRT